MVLRIEFDGVWWGKSISVFRKEGNELWGKRKKRGRGFWGEGVGILCFVDLGEEREKREGEWKERALDNFSEKENENVKIIEGNIGAMLECWNHILEPSLLINFKFNLKIK